jgi:hypothetical protein
MTTFRAAVESGDIEQIRALLAPAVTFRSPAVHAPYEGRDTVGVILAAVIEVFEDFRYVAEVRDGLAEVLRFHARVGDREVDGVDLVSYGDDGRVHELTVMIRPLSALTAVKDAMGARLEAMRGAAPAG